MQQYIERCYFTGITTHHMKVLFFTICLFLLSIVAESQDSLTNELVWRHTYSFTLEHNKAAGPGWDSLQQEFRKSQFVILGENHASPLLSLLTAKLLEEAKAAGYKHFMLETGPVTAKKIPALYNADATVFTTKMHGFLSAYKLEEGSPPSEFIAMKNDIPMLQSAVNNKFTIVGLDKEYYSSIRYLLDELKLFCATPALKAEYTRAMQRMDTLAKENSADEKYTYIIHCKQDTAINTFLDHVSQRNADAAWIVQEMRKTFRIYGLYEDKQYFLSEEVRMANIKQNFGNYYYKHIGNHPAAFKAFIKIGNVHSVRGMTYLGHYDVGNLVSELANLNGTSSTHIQGMRRYRKNDKEEVMDFYNKGYEVYPHIITQTDSTRWVIIDLRPLRELLVNGKLKVASKDERDLIRQNDIVLLTPVDEAFKGSLNYE
jgi:hypothetical protein